MDESVDDGDDAGGVGKDFAPFGEGFVGGDESGSLLVTTGDDFEEQISMTGVVGEIAKLVEDEELGSGKEVEPALER